MLYRIYDKNPNMKSMYVNRPLTTPLACAWGTPRHARKITCLPQCMSHGASVCSCDVMLAHKIFERAKEPRAFDKPVDASVLEISKECGERALFAYDDMSLSLGCWG